MSKRSAFAGLLRGLEGRSNTSDLPEEIGAVRKELGFSRKGFGGLLGVTEQTVSGWERGDYVPSTENLVLLANVSSPERAFYFLKVAKVDCERFLGCALVMMNDAGVDLSKQEAPPASVRREISVDRAAQMLTMEPGEVLALLKAGKLKGRTAGPNDTQLLYENWVYSYMANVQHRWY